MNEIGFSSKRLMKLIAVFVLSLLLPAGCGLLRNARIDQLIVWCFLSCMCTICFLIYIEDVRVLNISDIDGGDDFSLLLGIFLTGLIFSCACAFLPAYTAPVMAIGILCGGVFPSKLGAILASYFAVLTAIFCNREIYLYLTAAYVMLALIGCLLTGLAQRNRFFLWTVMLLVSMSVVVPACCCYLELHLLQPELIMILLPECLLTILMLRVTKRLRTRADNYEEFGLKTIMDKQYHLQRAISQYSSIDYEHALRVSRLCAKVAEELDANEALAQAGGFYYRIGRLEGEPFIENGIRLAQQNCFPMRLVRILEEYQGIQKPLSTLESAIVQISDMMITKFDLLDKDTFSAGWNREIVIYQTMNEKSEEGLYDHCCLSMNQFLKIRTILVKEELLL